MSCEKLICIAIDSLLSPTLNLHFTGVLKITIMLRSNYLDRSTQRIQIILWIHLIILQWIINYTKNSLYFLVHHSIKTPVNIWNLLNYDDRVAYCGRIKLFSAVALATFTRRRRCTTHALQTVDFRWERRQLLCSHHCAEICIWIDR